MPPLSSLANWKTWFVLLGNDLSVTNETRTHLASLPIPPKPTRPKASRKGGRQAVHLCWERSEELAGKTMRTLGNRPSSAQRPDGPLRGDIIQPSNCLTDDCPIAGRDRGDTAGLVEEFPSTPASFKLGAGGSVSPNAPCPVLQTSFSHPEDGAGRLQTQPPLTLL